MPFDEGGTATVIASMPKRATAGQRFVWVVGMTTGTKVKVHLRITQ